MSSIAISHPQFTPSAAASHRCAHSAACSGSGKREGSDPTLRLAMDSKTGRSREFQVTRSGGGAGTRGHDDHVLSKPLVEARENFVNQDPQVAAIRRLHVPPCPEVMLKR